MTVASVVSIVAYFGAFGEFLDAWSPFLAITIALVLSPALSLFFGQKVYLARTPTVPPAERSTEQIQCSVCLEHYEKPDIIGCPFHQSAICSLCCTLEKTCGSVCKD